LQKAEKEAEENDTALTEDHNAVLDTIYNLGQAYRCAHHTRRKSIQAAVPAKAQLEKMQTNLIGGNFFVKEGAQLAKALKEQSAGQNELQELLVWRAQQKQSKCNSRNAKSQYSMK
jgi:hypothetical protein